MFQIGDRVRRIAFTDCFGQDHAAVPNLTVIETHLETPTCAQDLPAYQRLTAVRGFAQYEGGAHFFEKEEENTRHYLNQAGPFELWDVYLPEKPLPEFNTVLAYNFFTGDSVVVPIPEMAEENKRGYIFGYASGCLEQQKLIDRLQEHKNTLATAFNETIAALHEQAKVIASLSEDLEEFRKHLDAA